VRGSGAAAKLDRVNVIVGSRHVFSRSLRIASRIAAALGTVEALAVIWLSFAAGSGGHNECLELLDARSSYSVTPPSNRGVVIGCERTRAHREAEVVLATEVALTLIGLAAASATAVKPIRRAEVIVARIQRGRRMRSLRPGGDVNVTQDAFFRRGESAQISEILPATDEFDVLVHFPDSDGQLYAFKHHELTPEVTSRCYLG